MAPLREAHSAADHGIEDLDTRLAQLTLHDLPLAAGVGRHDGQAHELEYMYDAGGTYHFMNSTNFDQIEMEEEALGDNAPWMQPGMKIQAEFYDGKPIGVRLPNSMTLTIVETNPVMKTATKTASSKPAKLENGVTVNVPEFVATGDKIRVNPGTGEYIERAK